MLTLHLFKLHIPMANFGDFSATVKQQADIVRVVGEYVKLRKAGAQNYTGLCPFHSEKTGSFSVHATRQFYHCFGCGVSGDVFSFVQKIENITFPEAVRVVAQKAGVPLPKMTFDSPQEAAEARMRGKLLEMQERACAFFQEQLRRPEGSHAREYLAGRGLTQEMIERFRIGYAPDSGFLLKDRLKGEFDEEALKASGLFSWKEDGPSAISTRPSGKPGPDGGEESGIALEPADPKADSRRPSAIYSKFRNRAMFPICNESGRIVGFTGRTLSTDEKAGPKYLNSPETAVYSKSRVLFNLDKAREAIRKLDYAILVEGQMDCISVYAAGFQNVIASSGTAFTEAQAKLLARYSRKVVVNFDPDTAGAAATERTLGLLVSEDFEIKVLSLEAGFDPDLYVRRRGAEAYATALRGSQKYFSYLIERARAQFPPRTPESKVKAVNYLLPHVQRVPSRIVRDELANEIAQKLGIDSAVLRQELKQAATSRAAKAVSATAESQVTPAERILLRALASGSRIQEGDGPQSAREGTDEEFDPARQARFFLEQEPLREGLASEGLLEALLEAGEAEPMSLPLEESERRLLAEVLLQEGDEDLTPELLEGAMAALRRRAAGRKLRQMQAELPAGGSGQDPLEQARLAQQRLKLKRTLSTGTGPAE